MHFYSKCLLCFFISTLGFLLIVTGDWRCLQRAILYAQLRRMHRPESPATSPPFVHSEPFARLTQDAEITRILDELDLLEPKNVTGAVEQLTINELVLVSAWSMRL